METFWTVRTSRHWLTPMALVLMVPKIECDFLESWGAGQSLDYALTVEQVVTQVQKHVVKELGGFHQ